MLRFLKTKTIENKPVTILHCWGFGLPISNIEFEEAYFFSNRSIQIYKNGRLWLCHNSV
jgi:hypothetical protein